MDYGRPAAQFEARNAIALAPDYLKKKVTVRGRVSSVDTSDPERCVVKLDHGVTAHFGKWKAAAEQYKVGEVIHLSGIVEAVHPSEITLDPAFGRDPKAPFDATTLTLAAAKFSHQDAAKPRLEVARWIIEVRGPRNTSPGRLCSPRRCQNRWNVSY